MAKRIFKIFGKIFLVILGVIILFILILTVINQIALKTDRNKLETVYGQSVEVFGKNMRVEITGSGEDVVVLLPGMGIPEPIMYNRPLASFLSENYTVVSVEYFGYGFSDTTDRPRTVKNISEEIHEVLNKLGYDEYILMPHSISGLYVLYYANQYPEKVKAVAGLDTSIADSFIVPDDPEEWEKMEKEMLANTKKEIFREKLLSNLGLRRFASVFLQGSLWEDELKGGKIAKGYIFPQEEVELYRILDLNTFNGRLDTSYDEELVFWDTLGATADLTFPDTIPVIHFLAQENEDNETSGGRSWSGMHESIVGDKERSRIVILDGGHMVMLTNPKEIAEEFNSWYREVKHPPLNV